MTRYPIYVRIEKMPPAVKVVGGFVVVYLVARGIGNILGDAALVYADDLIRFADYVKGLAILHFPAFI